MQVAAANPGCVRREDITAAELERERAVYQTQAEASGKPAQVIEKIVSGKVEKFYSEVCLLEQAYIREPRKTVQELVNDAVSKTGENIVVHRFARFQIGEAGTAEKGTE
jgi:elongation factor Ts